jgi:hypothetical protein
VRKIKDFLARPKTKYITIPLAVIILFSLAFAFQPVKVKVGERVVCKYGETITDRTKTITVPRLFAGSYGVKVSKSICPKHRTVERLYDDATRLIAQGDISTAGKILGSIKKRDPEFKDVDKRITKLNKELTAAGLEPIPTDTGNSSSSGGNGGSSGNSSGNNNSDGNSGGDSQGDGTPSYLYLLDRLPDKVSGYTLWAEDYTDLSAARTFYPDKSGTIKLLTMEVDSTGNAQSADNFIANEIKRNYPGDKDSNVKVGGNTCYFGTHANQFAMLAWRDGGIVYQVEMMAKSNPQNLKDDLISVAKSMK